MREKNPKPTLLPLSSCCQHLMITYLPFSALIMENCFPKAVLRVLEVQEYKCFVDIPIPGFHRGFFTAQNQQ